MSWTVDFGAWPQKWEELPEQIAVTNKETGEWDAYMLTSKAMRMIRDAKDAANWLHAELHGAELELGRVVRCKDCSHMRKSWNGKRPDFVPDGFFCAYWGGHQLWEPDGFCKWGERRGA